MAIDAAKNADFVLGQVSLQAKEFTTGIGEMIDEQLRMKNGKWADAVYDLSGRVVKDEKVRNGGMPRGLYVSSGRKVVVR